VIFLLFLFIQAVAAQTRPSAEGLEYFEKNIRPVLAERCYSCHSDQATTLRGDLHVDTRQGLLKGGKSGVATIVPGKPEESLLITALRQTSELKMPPDRPLPAEQVDAFAEWVRMGAPDPREGAAVADKPAYNFDEARKHWAYQPIKSVPPPAASAPEWSGNPIDRFVAAKLAEQKLKPLGLADKRTWLRRVTLDLTGLPPKPVEVDAFLKDESANAYEKVVDRLLATQQYAEQWGRHWLDVVRYADTAGDAADYPAHDMYRYRNWVINAFKDDKPFDAFLQEQLAGDLLPYKDDDDRRNKLIATGYLANARRFGQSDGEHYLTIDDTIDNVSKSMLGTSVACARCHDHKFDPIPNKDYYALYGIFKSTNYAFAGREHNQYQENLLPLDFANAEKFKTATESFKKAAGVVANLRKAATMENATAETRTPYLLALDDEERLGSMLAEMPTAYGASEGKLDNQRLMVKGDPRTLGPAVPRGFLEILGGQKVPADYKGSGRDLLAKWITDPANPLTPRVIVNRMWQWHFGKGIVATASDFGVRGERPTHPELLDFLAANFMENGWSIKKLHKMIVLSRTYRMASGHDAMNAETDPNNKFLWRFDRRRLAAEEIRDSMMLISGQLDLSMGGAHPFPPRPVTGFTQHKPFVAVPAEFQTDRRSVYMMQQRIRGIPIYDIFDGPDPNTMSDLRQSSTTALQSLFLMNDEFVHKQAERLAIRIGLAHDTTAARLTLAYNLIYSRAPTKTEVAAAEDFLGKYRVSLSRANVPAEDHNRQSLAALTRVLLGSNEFLYVD